MHKLVFWYKLNQLLMSGTLGDIPNKNVFLHPFCCWYLVQDRKCSKNCFSVTYCNTSKHINLWLLAVEYSLCLTTMTWTVISLIEGRARAQESHGKSFLPELHQLSKPGSFLESTFHTLIQCHQIKSCSCKRVELMRNNWRAGSWMPGEEFGNPCWRDSWNRDH